MSDPNKRFKKSTVDNLLETLSLTPDLNFSEDPQLEMMVEDIKSKLATIPVDELRESPLVRKQAAQDAADSSDTLELLMAELDNDPVLAERSSPLAVKMGVRWEDGNADVLA